MLNYAASERNRQPILEVLQQYLKASDVKDILEIGSGAIVLFF